MKATILSIFMIAPTTALFAQFPGFIEKAQEMGVSPKQGNYGVAIADFNGDGWDDFYISRVNGPNLLYKNSGDGNFVEIAQQAGIAVDGHSTTSVWGDIDNDGWLDLYVATWKHEPNRMFRNLGNETFEDITESSQTTHYGRTQSAIFADFDNDGYLDLYLSNFTPARNTLFKNNKDGTFTDVANEAKADESTYAMAAAPGDYDNDGDVDLYLTHDSFVPYTLLRNDGTGKFDEVSKAAGVNHAGQGMGADFGDFDNDGWLDLYVTNLHGNILYRNRGDGTFEDVTAQWSVGDSGMAWSTFFTDADLDGRLDLYVVKQSSYSSPPLPNVFYHNTGEQFQMLFPYDKISSRGSGVGGAYGDLNNDGTADFIVANAPDQHASGTELFVNGEKDRNWLQIRLEGVQSNRAAIGARIKLFSDGQWQMRYVAGGTGFASQNSLTQIFGIGSASRADSLVIYWPSGAIDAFGELQAKQRIDIREGETVTSVENVHDGAPAGWQLASPYPNPFAPAAGQQISVQYQTAKAGFVSLAIYNIIGQKIAEMYSGQQAAGTFGASWNGKLQNGKSAPAGLYFVQFTTPETQKVAKVLVIP